MAGADFFDITINGYGAHGAMPERSKDAVVIATTLAQALQTIVSRNVDPLKAAVLSITQIHAGSAYNVIPGDAKLCGTVRAFDDGVRALIRERMRAICAGIAATFQCEITVDIRDIFACWSTRKSSPGWSRKWRRPWSIPPRCSRARRRRWGARISRHDAGGTRRLFLDRP